MVSSAKQRAIALIILALAAGCSTQTPPVSADTPRNATVIRGAGATFPSLLYKKWFEVYEHSHPQASVSYDAVGSGEGVRRFIGSNIKERRIR